MGEASILTVDSGAMRSFGRYEMTAPLDGVFNVREAIRSCSPALESDAVIAGITMVVATACGERECSNFTDPCGGTAHLRSGRGDQRCLVAVGGSRVAVRFSVTPGG